MVDENNKIKLLMNFGKYNTKLGEYIESATFSSPEDNRFEWNIRTYPNGILSEFRDYIPIYLMYKSGPMPFVETTLFRS